MGQQRRFRQVAGCDRCGAARCFSGVPCGLRHIFPALVEVLVVVICAHQEALLSQGLVSHYQQPALLLLAAGELGVHVN